MNLMKSAKWIWCAGQDVRGYNVAARFRREFRAGKGASGELRITADSRYRVSLNGEWINDGPGKAYPEHFTYDCYDIGGFLKPDRNVIEVVARYYGVGTFHQIPQQAGLLAEVEVDGRVIGTDTSWESAPVEWLRREVPKVSCQMEPCEWVDARRDTEPDWRPSVELFVADGGPWGALSPRLSRPLTKQRCRPVAVHGAALVAQAPPSVCVPVTRIAHPGLIECNHRTSRPVVLAATFTLDEPMQMDFVSSCWRVAIDGRQADGPLALEAGVHTALFFCIEFYGHNKELGFPFRHLPGVRWGEWNVFVNDEFLFRDNDIVWMNFPNPAAERTQQGWLVAADAACSAWPSATAALPGLGRRVDIAEDALFLGDYTADFAARVPSGDAGEAVANPDTVCEGGAGVARIDPAPGCDVEICYDLGEQRCGYFDFELAATPGTVVDLHLVEYITPECVVQHTTEFNRNGMRFVCAEGVNRHLSLKRRSGRYLFVALRELASPVELRRIEIVESTADVRPVARFRSSDAVLDRVWSACERTLRMGMEDTFTDCSLYEQTLWIGDARNQALYASNIYGEPEVSARSLELGAQSLERFPIVGCQVPSTWECILPAWSFLWGMHVWEHYCHTGDRVFLETIWPAALRNLEGAYGFLDRHGLFSGTFWNLLEWAPIDDAHPTVMHNSLLLVAATRAAENCASALGDDGAQAWLWSRRVSLVEAINAWWDPGKRSFPDAILEDGTPSPKTSQHNSALAILAGVLPSERFPDARAHLLDPPAGMTRISSPFAAQFLYEALEFLGEHDAILASIRANYLPMIEAGATTVWETFPGSTCSPPGFPTRSHCHGWSCSPLQFFNRIFLGIRQTAPGGTEFEVSPWINGLSHASGAMATPHGPLQVSWRADTSEVTVDIRASETLHVVCRPNASFSGRLPVFSCYPR
jgi:alpha-L-rhamnosidase